MEKSSKNLISTGWQYYCKDGMLHSFRGLKKLQNCPDTTLEKIRKCASSFYKKFDENKGSRSLCRLEYCMWFSCILPSASVLHTLYNLSALLVKINFLRIRFRFRKFSKAKKCIRTALERNCDKNSWEKNAAKLYQDPYNPYCPGRVDLKRKPGLYSTSWCTSWINNNNSDDEGDDNVDAEMRPWD